MAAPLVLVGTVILSFLAALGVGYFVFDVDLRLPRLGPLATALRLRLPGRARRRLQHLPGRPRPRGDDKHGSEQGILRALAVTGGVITSAGIVLAGTFSVLAVLPLTFLTELGFVVAFGVLLDTFLVRSILVPAAALTLGDKFWWPSALSRPRRALGRDPLTPAFDST